MAATQHNCINVFTYRVVGSCLIQGLLQLIVALIGLQLIDGLINISSIQIYNEKFSSYETVAYLTYRTYFRDNCTVSNHENNESCRAPAAVRTYFWILFYITTCTVWVLTSLLLLVFAPESKKINIIGRLFRYWWMVVTAFVVFSDTFAFIQYLLDLEHTTNEHEYYRYIGLTPNETIHLQSCSKTAYIYIPPILMASCFSKGIIGWILTVILLISARKNFQKPIGPVHEVEKSEEIQNDSEESSTPNEDTVTTSTTTLSELPSSNSADQNYVPWMNVLYLPSIYEESNQDKVPEYYDEHHYEHVIGPHEVPGGITIEIPSKTKNNSNLTNLEDSQPNKIDPKLLKIDVGNICIQINQRNSRNSSSPYYKNLKMVKIPRASSLCSETDCNVHRAFNFISTQEDKPNNET